MWNRRPENQDMYERNKFVFRGQNYNWLIGKTSNNILILLTESQPSVDSMIIFSIKKSKIIDQDSNILKVHSHGT